ncbi:MAG: hypothetical protein IT168_14190 [Bryobacterales bacterium]|nr:hypothetical protein [Bryobacterales bacterium]
MSKTVELPDDLLAAVSDLALQQGTTSEQIIEEATRRHIALKRFDSFVRANEEQARSLGIEESHVPGLVNQYRREQRNRS